MARVQEKAFCVEELVQFFGLSEHAGILGTAHHGGGCGTIGFDTGKPAVERVLEIAGRIGLSVEEMKAQKEEQTEHGERSHGDAQTLDRRTDVGVGASGEIESNTQESARSGQRACDAGKTGLRKRSHDAFLGSRGPFGNGK